MNLRRPIWGNAMDVSSVILRARPEKLVSVRKGLAALPGVEIHADADDGRLVLTIECDRGEASAEVFLKLSELDGVLSASLVYQYCDDEPSGESTNESQ